MNDFDRQTLDEYCEAIGLKKLQTLWLEFSSETESFLNGCSQEKEKNELRLKFHNLRSDSLIFGLKKFSNFCAETENAILENASDDILDAKRKEARIIFNYQRQQVSAYFEEKI